MSAVILVPRRADNGWRDELWAYARGPFETLGIPIVEGHDDNDGPFNRARALNLASDAASDWTVALIIDADVVIPAKQANRAIDRAAITGAFTFAYDRRRNLNRQATMRLLHAWPITIEARPAPNAHVHTDLRPWPASASCSSAVAVTRDLFDAVGGFDERFVGWGWEDVAFHRSCLTLGPPADSVEGDLLHCWHARPKERVAKDERFMANKTLGERYKAAMGDPDAIRALIAERIEVTR